VEINWQEKLMIPSKVLVTGVNGFVGRHLVGELRANDIEVVGVGGPDKITGDSRVDYLALDLTNAETAKEIDFTGVDGVVHLAGLAAVGPSFDDPLKYLTTNVGIEVNLFEAALAQKATPKFLIISTGGLYDPATKLPITELSPVIPSSPYAVSKLSQEQMAGYYAGRGFECVIARPFNHIGPGQGLGFLIPDLAKQIVDVENRKLSELSVGNLEAKRDYTDVRDIVRAYRLLLEKGKPGEAYNICSGTARSGHEILEQLLKLSKAQPKVVQDHGKLRPSDNPVIYGAHEKLSKDTGWQPEISIEQTLGDVIADWRARD
jgi:GDP-4-dehydro-6-deoxy-D-mannose reductase